MLNLRNITYTGFCIALGIILPLLFHVVGLGSTFTPMHIPVLLCGLCFGPVSGLVCGLVCPFLSAIITGMPPLFPAAFTMTFECTVYGFCSGYLYRNLKLNLFVSLILSMIAGRIAGGLLTGFILGFSNYSFSVFFNSYFVVNLPGVILNLIVVPLLVIAIEKSKVLKKEIVK